MRVGLQYIAQSRQLKGVLLRIWIFFFHSTGLMALLPLVAHGMQGGDAATFTLLLASMGAGAIGSTALLPRLRRRYARDALVLRGAWLQAGTMAVMAWTDQLWIAVPAMLLGGAAWITTANSLSVSIQLGLPDWVRARGMSMYQMAIMGASASGAALWGQIATWSNVPTSLAIAAGTGALTMWLTNRLLPDSGQAGDLTPRRIFQAPQHPGPASAGRVSVMIEYRIDPAQAAAFRTLMMDESRPSRLRQGALSWELLHDLEDPGRFIELVTDESWTDHLRRFERVTAADAELHARKLAFHLGPEPPRVTRCLMETSVK